MYICSFLFFRSVLKKKKKEKNQTNCICIAVGMLVCVLVFSSFFACILFRLSEIFSVFILFFLQQTLTLLFPPLSSVFHCS